MKKLMMIAVMCLLGSIAYSVDYTNAPAFTNGQYYVFSDGAVATNSLFALNNGGWFPIVGNNAKTGQPRPDKERTVRWCDTVQIRLDGKFVYPRVPTDKMDYHNIPEEQRKAWWDAFKPDVEVVGTNWFPIIEEQ